ncbi:unnamed protein product [Schistocephalus solidus]|uniref:Uncharacterized protein n=1 Tax=Schistocephalus solidus TaxID=70667 RepID=A0A183TAW0_SCHSO|nr:unnamed protein product [Schistocephalus solidus]
MNTACPSPTTLVPTSDYLHPQHHNSPQYQRWGLGSNLSSLRSHIHLTHRPGQTLANPSHREWRTQHLSTYLVLIVTAHAHQASAWSTTYESIAQRPASQWQEHQHTLASPESTAHTAHTHSHTAWAY